jgi:SNF family Na+-dependent transporter
MTAQWRFGTGFIITIVGAGLGLGYIWHSACIAGGNGGALLLLVDLIFLQPIGLPLVIAKLATGTARRRRRSG